MAADAPKSDPHAPPEPRSAQRPGRYVHDAFGPSDQPPAVPADLAAGGYLTAQISAGAVRENLAAIRRAIGPRTRLCAVVKSDAYGHSLRCLLPTIAAAADWLAVTIPAEALQLRDMGHDGPVLMFFSPCAYGDTAERARTLRELVARDVTLTVVSPDEIGPVAEAARAAGREARVHIKIDSGMSRSGVQCDQAGVLADAIRTVEGIRLDGLYTHFATADEPASSVPGDQLRRFREAAEACGGPAGLTLHAANSAATLTRPETHLDMVRPGIAIYGYRPDASLEFPAGIRPALRLVGPLMQVKRVPAGSRCGYGLTYTFKRDSRIGLVPVGYADGFGRALSNRGVMRIRGQDVLVRGRISMDQTILDLTDTPDAAVGDEVEIISPDPSAPNSVEHIARLCGTIPYEVTCRLGGRVRRVLVE